LPSEEPVRTEPGGRLDLLAAAVLFSTGGVVIKACTLTSWQVAGFRSGIAAIALALLLPAETSRVSRRALAVGAAYAATMLLFVTSNKLTTAANTIFLQSTSPLYLLLLGPLVLREQVTSRDIVFMAALAAGLVLFFVGTDPTFATAPDPRRGNLLAALSGLTWALTVGGLRWISAIPGATRTALISGNLIALLLCLPWSLPLDGTALDWLLISYLGVFQISLSYFFLSRGLRHVRAFEASLLLLVEPALASIWAALVHGELPGPLSLAGCLVILGSTAAKAWSERE
jgi:DME family drug/metabolite transporter